MNLQRRHEITEALFQECLDIAKTKGKDYSGNEDCLDNFKRAAKNLGMTPFQIWAVYFSKHIDSVMNAIKYHPEYPQVESEPLRGRIKDIIVYSVLLECLMEDEKTDTISGF